MREGAAEISGVDKAAGADLRVLVSAHSHWRSTTERGMHVTVTGRHLCSTTCFRIASFSFSPVSRHKHGVKPRVLLPEGPIPWRQPKPTCTLQSRCVPHVPLFERCGFSILALALRATCRWCRPLPSEASQCMPRGRFDVPASVPYPRRSQQSWGRRLPSAAPAHMPRDLSGTPPSAQ